jgi:hypothetical protein
MPKNPIENYKPTLVYMMTRAFKERGKHICCIHAISLRIIVSRNNIGYPGQAFIIARLYSYHVIIFTSYHRLMHDNKGYLPKMDGFSAI